MQGRSFGDFERAMWLQSYNFPYNIVAKIKINTNLSLLTLRKALDHLQSNHPLLRAVIKNDVLPRLEFKEGKKILIKSVRDASSGRVEKECGLLIYKKFKYDKEPLCRVVFLQGSSNYLLLNFHHLVLDGISTVTFIDELFSTIASIENKKKLSKRACQCEYSSFEDLIGKKSHFFDKRFLIKRARKKIKTGFLEYTIDKKGSAKIFSFIEKQKIPLLALFTAALITVFRKRFALDEEILYQVPFNLRPYLKTGTAASLGCLISMPVFFQKGKSLSFIQLAREVFHKIHEIKNKNILLATYKKNENILEGFHSNIEINDYLSWKKPGFGISKLGRLKLQKKYGKITIENIFFLTAMHGNFTRKENLYAVIYYFDEKIFLSVYYPKPYLKKKEARNIIKQALAFFDLRKVKAFHKKHKSQHKKQGNSGLD